MAVLRVLTGLFVVVYLLGTGAFFALCAWAQTNDPDPVLWVVGYVIAGPVVAIAALVGLFGFGVGALSRGTSNRVADTAADTAHTFALVLAMLVCWWLYAMYGKLQDSLNAPPRDLMWALLQLEEGREVVGLALLCMHNLNVHALTSTSPAGRRMTTSSLVTTTVSLALIGAAVYAWVYFQPLMNQRDDVSHCKGAFQ